MHCTDCSRPIGSCECSPFGGRRGPHPKPPPVLSKHQMQLALQRIAEIDGPIECTSLQDWQRKVKVIANNTLEGVK